MLVCHLLNHRFSRLWTMLYLLWILLLSSPAWGFFSRDVGETANITIAVDVVGTATVTPYLILPDGETLSQPSVSLTDTVGYTYPTFVVDAPGNGRYTVSIFVIAQTDAVVSANTEYTRFANSVISLFLRPTDLGRYSVSPKAGEKTLLILDCVYTDACSGGP